MEMSEFSKDIFVQVKGFFPIENSCERKYLAAQLGPNHTYKYSFVWPTTAVKDRRL